MHERNIIHRDIKPENILLTESLETKLCDFGWSCFYNPREPRRSNSGTHEYNSPEMLLKKPQTKSVDIWMLGLVLYELYFNHLPFKDPSLFCK